MVNCDSTTAVLLSRNDDWPCRLIDTNQKSLCTMKKVTQNLTSALDPVAAGAGGGTVACHKSKVVG